ncbi:MAG: leucyl-tRNA synthetase, eubacterial and mitochondrial family [Candidatus Doudnabacteria bacterium]|nr:leucyl-tRNA synthetase, eubacterial and mitochondrial family [Candidatus Doudnabacteria bacterium]
MYNPQKTEKKWHKIWKAKKVYESKDFSTKPKKYVLVEFPYPSGAGLHTGHLRSYVASDVVSRYSRAKGFEVMYPFGWDAFGLPAENYALKMGVQPQVSTAKNIRNFKKQVNALGISFDWSREVNTTDPKYYKWTQWLFLQFYKAGLAYEAESMINWCPKDKTGLANEEVIDGKCDRCGTPVEKKMLRQWYLKITEYAQQLIDGLKDLDWPEPVKVQQANWIGRSEGAEIEFKITSEVGEGKATVFTTRPDTLYGATYLVLAPEHVLLEKLKPAIQNWTEVQKYIKKASNKTDLQRSALEKEKSGAELKGVYAINPATKKKVSVWIADYVLNTYGTGAIMAVPAHDQRDKQFAEKYELPIKQVIRDEIMINSGELNDLSTLQAKKKIIAKYGKLKIQYKLRDWVFSRQRYWGEPIPLIHCDKCGIVPVPEDQLPVILPKVKKYEPTGTGESPLAAIDSWVNVKCPKCSGAAKRETNTMPQWAGSSWYFLRYTDPKNTKRFADPENLKYWMPIDVYFGGMEHTTLHLLYSRFWNLFLYDQGLVPVKEPYTSRQPHGIILGPDGEKMSKSRGNVASPDQLVKQYGADTTRMFQMFLGPHEQTVSWNEEGIVGVHRFLQKTWAWVSENAALVKKGKTQDSSKAETLINKLIKKVTEDIEGVKFNTAISSFMEFINEVAAEKISKQSLQKFVIILAPFAPHLSEELWSLLGGKASVTLEAWPEYDQSKTVSATVQFVVQVNGKFRGNIEAPKSASQKDLEASAKALEAVTKAIGMASGEIKKIIFVPGRLINFVA